MGYCMEQRDCAGFKIKAENVQKALKAIQALHGKESIKDASGRHFSWVGEDFYKIDNLKDMLREWRWEGDFDEDGNIVYLSFCGEKLGDDEVLFEALAPFIESGAEIEMEGEDGSLWKWCFENGEMREKHGRVVYD